MSSGPRTTYRSPGTVGWGVAGLVLLGGLAVLPGVPLVLRVGAVLGAVATAWVSLWVRLVVDDEGATAYYGRRRHVAWADVDEVMLHLRRGLACLVLSTAEGPVTVWAVAESSRRSGMDYCRSTTKEVQERWARSTRRTRPDTVEGPDVRERAA